MSTHTVYIYCRVYKNDASQQVSDSAWKKLWDADHLFYIP